MRISTCCAVCGYDLRLDTTPVGLVEAAYIKWKQYGGPCTVTNGLPLCSVHHCAFDIGVLDIDDSMKLMVSEGVNGSNIVERPFWDFEGKPLFLLKKWEYYPLEQFIEWHRGRFLGNNTQHSKCIIHDRIHTKIKGRILYGENDSFFWATGNAKLRRTDGI